MWQRRRENNVQCIQDDDDERETVMRNEALVLCHEEEKKQVREKIISSLTEAVNIYRCHTCTHNFSMYGCDRFSIEYLLDGNFIRLVCPECGEILTLSLTFFGLMEDLLRKEDYHNAKV